MRPCPKCGGTERYAKNGLCKECHRNRQRKWAKANPEKQREMTDRWEEANPGRSRKYQRVKNGWAPGEHERAEAAAKSVSSCACCASVAPKNKRGWMADHDHVTGKFRAHVCHPCNQIIGWIESRFYQAEDYPRQKAYLLSWASVSAM